MCEVLSFPNFAKKIRHASIHIIPLFYNHKNECVPTKKYYHAQLIFFEEVQSCKMQKHRSTRTNRKTIQNIQIPERTYLKLQ